MTSPPQLNRSFLAQCALPNDKAGDLPPHQLKSSLPAQCALPNDKAGDLPPPS